MSIGRKHFGAIANAVANADYLTNEQRETIARDLAREVKSVAANLDRDRFLEACGIKEGALA